MLTVLGWTTPKGRWLRVQKRGCVWLRVCGGVCIGVCVAVAVGGVLTVFLSTSLTRAKARTKPAGLPHINQTEPKRTKANPTHVWMTPNWGWPNATPPAHCTPHTPHTFLGSRKRNRRWQAAGSRRQAAGVNYKINSCVIVTRTWVAARRIHSKGAPSGGWGKSLWLRMTRPKHTFASPRWPAGSDGTKCRPEGGISKGNEQEMPWNGLITSLYSLKYIKIYLFIYLIVY